MDFGTTFRNVRLAHNLKQQNIAAGIMSRTSISQIEHGKQNPTYDSAQILISRLGLSADEFEYVKNGYKRTETQEVIYQFMHLSDSTETNKIQRLLLRAKECNSNTPSTIISDVIIVLTAMNFIDIFDYEKLHNLVAPIWENLQHTDTWTTLDLYMINGILYFFDNETSQNIASLALHFIDAKFPHLLGLKNAFLLNSAYLSIQKNDLDSAKRNLKISGDISLKLHRFDLLWLAKARYALTDRDFKKVQSIKKLLIAMGADTIVSGLDNEIKELQYSNLIPELNSEKH
jgi:transcriptional regulator with XRE-family HTH domain